MAAQAALYAGLAGLQLAGSYFAAENMKETAALNREIADMNAEFAELDAYDAEIEGFSAEARYQKVIDATLGEQTAALTSAGIDITSGSARAIIDETRMIGEFNKMEIEKNAQEQALGLERQARQYALGGFLESLSAEARAEAMLFQGVISSGQTGLTGYRRSQ